MRNEPSYLGEVISVSGSSILIELTPQVKSGLLIIEGRTHRIGQVGSFIRIPQGYNHLFGVISETSESPDNKSDLRNGERRTIRVELVGESVGSEFERGISQFPSISDEAHLVTEGDLKTIYGTNDVGQVVIGKLSSSDSIDVSIDLDALVNRHSAVLGSTGSGKSTSVSSLLRAIATDSNEEITRPSSRIVLFDLHGEYAAALGDISNVFSVTPGQGEEQLFIPYWCVSPENLIDFLCGPTNENFKSVFMDLMVEEKKEFIKNNKLTFEKAKVTPYTPFPFRLHKIWYDMCHEDNVNFQEKEKLTPSYISKGDYKTLEAPKFNPPCTVLASLVVKGGTQSMKKPLSQMRSRLLDAQFSFFLSPGNWTPDNDLKISSDLPSLVNDWIGKPKPITILDLSGMPSSRLDLLLGSLLDILFESSVWGRNLIEGMKENPLLLVMEEAHRYLSNETNGLSKDMVRRIVKEGRKFGVGSMLVSQRPSEIDETILSQCGTLIALRINNATDRSKVKSAMSDGLSGIIDSLPILRTGEAIIAGEAAKLPMRCKFKIPSNGRFPDSKDPKVSDQWSKEFNQHDFTQLVKCWRMQVAEKTTK